MRHDPFPLMPFRFKNPDELPSETQRIATEQIDRAIDELDDSSLDYHETIHQVRKRCKKLRGLLRLVRSGSTITGGLFAGFDRATAAKFSFLLSVPSILAAAVFSVNEHWREMTGPLLMPAIVANVAAFISGYAAIEFLIRYLQTRGVGIFVAYRLVLGLIIIGLLQTGFLEPMQGIQPR